MVRRLDDYRYGSGQRPQPVNPGTPIVYFDPRTGRNEWSTLAEYDRTVKELDWNRMLSEQAREANRSVLALILRTEAERTAASYRSRAQQTLQAALAEGVVSRATAAKLKEIVAEANKADPYAQGYLAGPIPYLQGILQGTPLPFENARDLRDLVHTVGIVLTSPPIAYDEAVADKVVSGEEMLAILDEVERERRPNDYKEDPPYLLELYAHPTIVLSNEAKAVLARHFSVEPDRLPDDAGDPYVAGFWPAIARANFVSDDDVAKIKKLGSMGTVATWGLKKLLLRLVSLYPERVAPSALKDLETFARSVKPAESRSAWLPMTLSGDETAITLEWPQGHAALEQELHALGTQSIVASYSRAGTLGLPSQANAVWHNGAKVSSCSWDAQLRSAGTTPQGEPLYVVRVRGFAEARSRNAGGSVCYDSKPLTADELRAGKITLTPK